MHSPCPVKRASPRKPADWSFCLIREDSTRSDPKLFCTHILTHTWWLLGLLDLILVTSTGKAWTEQEEILFDALWATWLFFKVDAWTVFLQFASKSSVSFGLWPFWVYHFTGQIQLGMLLDQADPHHGLGSKRCVTPTIFYIVHHLFLQHQWSNDKHQWFNDHYNSRMDHFKINTFYNKLWLALGHLEICGHWPPGQSVGEWRWCLTRRFNRKALW